MQDVADRLGWPIQKVYRVSYVIRQMEKELQQSVLLGKISKKAQLERSLRDKEKS